MWETFDFIKANFGVIFPALVTFAGLVFMHRTGYKISLESQKATLRKTDTEAADSVRDDLMKQVEEANKRIDKKDEIIDGLKDRIYALEKTNLKLEWEVYIKTAQIEQMQKQLDLMQLSIDEVTKKLKDVGYGQ